MKLLLVFAAVVVLCALVSAEKETKAKQHKKEERTAAKAHHGKSAKSRAAATAHAEKSKREHAPHGVKKSERKHDSKQKKANRSKGAKKAVRGRANREGDDTTTTNKPSVEEGFCPDGMSAVCNFSCVTITCNNYGVEFAEWFRCWIAWYEHPEESSTCPQLNEETGEEDGWSCQCDRDTLYDEESEQCVRLKDCPATSNQWPVGVDPVSEN